MKDGKYVAAIVGVVLLGFAGAAAAQGPAQVVLYGKSYGEWSAQWWQWARSIPASFSPVLLTDEDPAFDCSLGQQGPVWFLAGLPAQFEGFDKFVSREGERTCMVPQAKALFFPLVNSSFVNEIGETTCGGPCTVEEKRAILDAFSFVSFGCALNVMLDGESLYTDVVAKTQSPPFPVLIGADDPFGTIEGSNDPESISDGYWAMLGPLSPGNHELVFSGSLCSLTEIPDPEPETAPFSLAPFFSVEVTYHLTVAGTDK